MTAVAPTASAASSAGAGGGTTVTGTLDGDRTAGLLALLSAPIGLLSLVAVLAAADWDAEIFETPVILLSQGSSAADGVRWAMVLDILGYYALMVPALLALRRHLARRDRPLAQLGSTAGLAYLVTGAVGAAVLAVTWPLALDRIGGAGPSEAAAVTATFEAISEAVIFGMWNLLGSLAAAVWLLVTARLTWSDRRGFAVLSAIIGVAGALDAVGVALDAPGLSAVPLQVYLYGLLVWAVWLGVLLWRRQPIVS